MILEILSPEKNHLWENVQSITLPGTLGSFQVLKNHAPLISSLRKGTILFAAEGHLLSIEVTEGFVEVLNNRITVCIDSVTKETAKK